MSAGQDGRRRLTSGWIAVIVSAAVVAALVVAGVVGVALWMVVRSSAPLAHPVDGQPVVAGSQQSTGARAAIYAFGHASSSLVPSQAQLGTSQVQRLRFTATADAESFRLQMRNLVYIDDTALPGSVHVESVYVGAATDDEERADFAAEPVRILGPTTLVGGDLSASAWIGVDAFALESGTDYVVSMALAFDADQPLAVSTDESWQLPGGGAEEARALTPEMQRVPGTSLLDAWIELGTDADEPVVAVLGHSMSTGVNANPDQPQRGESGAWHQVWAREHGGIGSSMAVPGSISAQYAPDSPKWELGAQIDADVVAIWASSTDLIQEAGVDEVHARWTAMVDRARAVWPDAVVVGFTEPPRGAVGVGEQDRLAWNALLRTMPDGLDVLVDADALFADPADPSRLAPAIDGDTVHVNLDGQALAADAFEEALVELGMR